MLDYRYLVYIYHTVRYIKSSTLLNIVMLRKYFTYRSFLAITKPKPYPLL